jgi:hypothetical protein
MKNTKKGSRASGDERENSVGGEIKHEICTLIF